MEIALVFPGCGRRGGVERIMWEAARHLSPRHRVTVVSVTADDLPAGAVHLPVPVSRGPGVLRPVAFGRAAWRALAAGRFDVVVAYGAECPPADVYVVNSVHRAWLAAAGPVALRGRLVPGQVRAAMPRHLVSLGLERRYYAGARGRQLVPCAEQVGADLATYYGLGANPSTVVHNGFSPDEFSPQRRTSLRPEARRSLAYDDRDVVLVMVANEWQRKGLGTVLGAMARLDDPRLKLLLAGRTPPGDLVARAAPDVRRRVRYVGSADDVGRVHAAGDVFVLPTQYEAFCLAVVEALASGLPVVTSGVPGAADVMVPGVNGLVLADPLSAPGLAALLRQAADPDRRRAWSEAAPGTVAGYRWDRLMGRFEEVLSGVADPVGGG